MVKTEMPCFGQLDKVFPVGDEGLREVPSTCFDCAEKTPCMKAALASKEGLAFRGEILGRTDAKGLLGRLRRWSRKKELTRLMKEREKERETP